MLFPAADVMLWLFPVINIDAHKGGGGRGEGGASCTPLKDVEKYGHKNTIKHENRGPLLDFITTPQYPPQKNLNMTVHLLTH